MSAVLERVKPACTSDIPQKTGKSVATIEQFLLQHPVGKPILAIGAGSFRVNFHTVACPECGSPNLLRHYCVKTLAVVKSNDRLDYAQHRAQLATMDGIALAKEFIDSSLWITASARGQYIGLDMLYMPFSKWISQSNAIVASRISSQLSAGGDVLPQVAAFRAGNDANGHKCLRAVCRHCDISLSISDSCGPIRLSFTLQGQDGEKVMLPWALAVGGHSGVALVGQQALQAHQTNSLSSTVLV